MGHTPYRRAWSVLDVVAPVRSNSKRARSSQLDARSSCERAAPACLTQKRAAKRCCRLQEEQHMTYAGFCRAGMPLVFVQQLLPPRIWERWLCHLPDLRLGSASVPCMLFTCVALSCDLQSLPFVLATVGTKFRISRCSCCCWQVVVWETEPGFRLPSTWTRTGRRHPSIPRREVRATVQVAVFLPRLLHL